MIAQKIPSSPTLPQNSEEKKGEQGKKGGRKDLFIPDFTHADNGWGDGMREEEKKNMYLKTWEEGIFLFPPR